MPALLYESIVIAYLLALAVIAWSDVATRIVPNSATIIIALLGIVIRSAAGPEAVLLSGAVAVVLFTFLAFLHSYNILGGGDAKLISAAALGLAPLGTLHLIVAIALSGGVLALLHLSLRRLPRPAPCPPGAPFLARVCTVERWRIRRHGSIPYAVAIAAGTTWVLLTNYGG